MPIVFVILQKWGTSVRATSCYGWECVEDCGVPTALGGCVLVQVHLRVQAAVDEDEGGIARTASQDPWQQVGSRVSGLVFRCRVLDLSRV